MKKNSLQWVMICAATLLFSACSSDSGQSLVSYPDQQSQGFKAFSQSCSSCHRPPMPMLHTAGEWKSVIYRMQKHRTKRGLQAMNTDEEKQILAYLQGHSKRDKQP